MPSDVARAVCFCAKPAGMPGRRQACGVGSTRWPPLCGILLRFPVMCCIRRHGGVFFMPRISPCMPCMTGYAGPGEHRIGCFVFVTVADMFLRSASAAESEVVCGCKAPESRRIGGVVCASATRIASRFCPCAPFMLQRRTQISFFHKKNPNKSVACAMGVGFALGSGPETRRGFLCSKFCNLLHRPKVGTTVKDEK